MLSKTVLTFERLIPTPFIQRSRSFISKCLEMFSLSSYFCSVHRGLKIWRPQAISLMLMSSVTHWPEQWALFQNPFPLTSNPIYWTIPEIRGNHSPIRPLSQCQVSQWVGSEQKCPVFYLVLDSKLLLNILNFGIKNFWYPISLVWDGFIDTE